VVGFEISVLIIDDSALMRRTLKKIIESQPGLKVAGAAGDGIEGLKLVKTLQPDVVTIDVNLPGMDGLTCLQHIMIECPRPCIMISAYTGEFSSETFEALELGAVDFVEKPSGEMSRDLSKKASEIASKIRAAYNSNLLALHIRKPDFKRAKKIPRPEGVCRDAQKIVVVGVSTGGPRTLMDIIPSLPDDLDAPVVIVQHMPKKFTGSFAERLNRYSAMEVKEASDGEPLKSGVAYVAPGDSHLLFTVKSGRVYTALQKPGPDEVLVPSVDKTLFSAMAIFGNRTVGVILTGMGADGCEAMTQLHQMGGFTIAESKESAIIFGMPAAVIERGAARVIAPASKIAETIVKALKHGWDPERNHPKTSI
jgi:two-component system chemotaxis response regulator CheB